MIERAGLSGGLEAATPSAVEGLSTGTAGLGDRTSFGLRRRRSTRRTSASSDTRQPSRSSAFAASKPAAMPRRGGRRKKSRTQEAVDDRPKVAAAAPAKGKGAGKATPPPQAADRSEKAIPRSMIVRRGNTSKHVAELLLELRKVMAPHTALKLREKATNTLKDFVHAAQPLGVSHLLMLAQRETQVNLRIARLPTGPTLALKVLAFELARTVRAAQKRPFDTTAAYATAPLVVLNNFGADEAAPHVKLLRVTFEAMFAPIDVSTVKLADCRRVVLVERDPATDVLELRHYAIRASASGVSKTVKRVVEAKGKTPDLSKLRDISEYVRGLARPANDDAYGSDSEAENDAKVVLAGKYAGRSNVKHRESAIKLAELGPRLTMKLYKVQRGVCDGDVLYHAFAGDRATAGADLSKQPTSRGFRDDDDDDESGGDADDDDDEADDEEESGEEVDDDDDEDEDEDGDADDEGAAAPPRPSPPPATKKRRRGGRGK